MAASTNPSDWDAHATDYRRLFSPFTGYLAQVMLRMVEARLPAGAAILDIACGPGDLAIAAGAHLSSSGSGAEVGRGRVLALDRSAAMVALARAGVEAAGLAHVVRCEEGDGEALQVEDGSFDAAFSSLGIFLFSDRRRGWQEAARALRPGGLFVTSVWRAAEYNALARVQLEILGSTLPERLTLERSGPDWEDIFTREGLTSEICEAAPFVDVSISDFEATMAIPTPLEMWRGVRENPIAGGILAECTGEELVRVRRAFLTRMEEMAGGADRAVLLSAACHILVARRA